MAPGLEAALLWPSPRLPGVRHGRSHSLSGFPSSLPPGKEVLFLGEMVSRGAEINLLRSRLNGWGSWRSGPKTETEGSGIILESSRRKKGRDKSVLLSGGGMWGVGGRGEGRGKGFQRKKEMSRSSVCGCRNSTESLNSPCQVFRLLVREPPGRPQISE